MVSFPKNGYLDCPDPKDSPASFLVQNEWFDLLKKAVKSADEKNWYAWYHLGLCYFARDLYEDALNAFETSMALEQSTWGYHGLANVWRVLGDEHRSAYLMAKARALNPGDLPLAKEALRFAYEAGEYALMNSVYDELTDEQRAAPMVQAYHAFALAHTGRPEEALAILEAGGGLEIPDLREGDNSVPNEYIFIRQTLAAREGRTLDPEEVVVPEKVDFRMFHARAK
ncbi:MAG: tetratricopeptide repeat protein [Ruthenibacterium lactatiformans]